MKYNYLSFFSGALGLDLGLEKAGFNCLSVNEIDPIFCETIKSNIKAKIYNTDIRNLTVDQLTNDLSLNQNNLFLIAGGPPCQSFSSAGKMQGLDDIRGNVSLSYVELIVKLKPTFFILENVRGLLTAEIKTITESLKPYEKHITLNKKGGVLYLITKIFEDNGYYINFDLYNTAFFNVPQSRERLIMIGSLLKKVPLLSATNSNIKEHNLKPFKTFNDACSDLTTETAIKFDSHRYEFLEKIPEGGNWKSLSIEDQKKAMGQSFFSGGGKSGFYRRLDGNKPSPTITTSPRMPATMLCHPTKLRPLSIEEYARLQTFPDSHKISGNLTQKYKQIGNAVPVEFGYAIGQHILNCFLIKDYNPKYIKTTKYSNTNYDDFMKSY